MKKVILLLIFIAIGSAGFSQTVSHILDYTKYVGEDIPRTLRLSGSIYLNDDFSQGRIVDTEKNNEQAALLRYNALEDLVEVKLDKNSEAKVLPRLSNLEYYFEGNKLVLKTIKIISGESVEGYFLEYYSNNELGFFAKPQLTMRKNETRKFRERTYELFLDFRYFIQKDGEINEVKLRNRDFKKLFSDKYEAESYFNKNNLRDVEEVLRFLEFYTRQSGTF